MGRSAETLIAIDHDLAREVRRLRFGQPVACVYRPLDYARRPHEQYLRRYGSGRKDVLLVGMNPGPWGMAQTGVPFGEPGCVRDWLGIEARVDRPSQEHPKRPVDGFECRRREVSGLRLWGWAARMFGTAERFFEQFFVGNYCPLCFLEASGRNRTPDKLPRAERERLFAACDRALRRCVEVLQPRVVVGVGAFAEGRARVALAGVDVSIGRVLHPSPASPAANRGWEEKMNAALAELDIRLLSESRPKQAVRAPLIVPESRRPRVTSTRPIRTRSPSTSSPQNRCRSTT